MYTTTQEDINVLLEYGYEFDDVQHPETKSKPQKRQ